MRNLKKILALVLSLMMVLSVMVTASAADYSDADEIQYTEAVDLMSALGILKGADGKFDPNGTLTREQAAKIIAFIKLGVETDNYLATLTTDRFADVTNNWAMKYVAYCSNEGIIDGGKDADGVLKFDPKGTLTGYQFGKMVLNALGIDGEYANNPNWTLEVAKNLNLYGLKEGMETIVLSAKITREQAAQLAFNAMKYSATASVSGYYFDVDGYRDIIFSTRSEAMIFGVSVDKTNLTADKIKEYKDTTGSILATTWKTTPGTKTDEFGRKYTTWVIDKSITGTDADVTVVASTEAAKYTFTATKASTVTNKASMDTYLNTVLGITDAEKEIGVASTTSKNCNILRNGKLVTSWGDTNINIGDKVEVYLKAGTNTVEKIIITRYDLYTVGKTTALNPKVASEAKLIKAGYSTKTTYTAVTTGTTETVYDNTYAEKSYVLAVIIGKEAVLSAEAETVTGKIDATKGTTDVRLGGVWYKVAGSVTAGITTKDAVYVINEQGALETVVTEDEAPTIPNIYYLVATYNIATDASKDEYGQPIDGTTSYYAQIVDLNGVESKVLIGWQKTGDDTTLVGVKSLIAGKFVTYAANKAAAAVKLGIMTFSDAPAAYNKDTAPVFATTLAGALNKGATTAGTGTSKVYVNDATKYVFLKGNLSTLKTNVITGSINAAVASGAKALVTKDADGNNIVVAVIAGDSYVDEGIDANDYLYALAQKDTVKTYWKTNEDGTVAYKYEYEVYSVLTGEKMTIEAEDAFLAGGFYSYKVTDGVYKLADASSVTGVKSNETYTGKFGTKINSTSIVDYEAADTVIVDLRTDAQIAADELEALSTLDEVHAASADYFVKFDAFVDSTVQEVIVIFITGVTAK